MSGKIFIALGLVIVAGILILTFLHDQSVVTAPTPSDETLVPEPEPEVGEPDEPAVVEPSVSEIQVFFSNTQRDPGAVNCEQVFPVTRAITPTVAVAKEALDQLLSGVMAVEKSEGYISNLASGARVESLVVADGEATVTFSNELATGLAGSCKVTAARAQIEATLRQFSSIQSVVIRIDGVPDEEVLQP
ncbi:MAG: GerMN domain-containing protein [Patescibacteria group bacterium]